MKRIISLVLPLAIILLCATSFITSCSKDTDCEVVVTVKFANDENAIVQGANVKVWRGGISAQGVTNAKGEFSCMFPNPAILDVEATYAGFSGTSSIRLVEGKEATTTVYLK